MSPLLWIPTPYTINVNFRQTNHPFSHVFRPTISSPVTNYIRINWNICTFDTAYNRRSNETMILRKYVTKHKNMRKSMVEFRRKFWIVALKLLKLTRFLSPNLSIYFNFVRWWVRCDRGRFSVHSLFIEKSMVVFILLYTFVWL